MCLHVHPLLRRVLVLQQMQGGDGEVPKEDEIASSEGEAEGDKDPDGVLTRLQSAVDAMEARTASRHPYPSDNLFSPKEHPFK